MSESFRSSIDPSSDGTLQPTFYSDGPRVGSAPYRGICRHEEPANVQQSSQFFTINATSLIGKDLNLNPVCYNFRDEHCADPFKWKIERSEPTGPFRESTSVDISMPGMPTGWVVKERSDIHICMRCRVIICQGCLERGWEARRRGPGAEQFQYGWHYTRWVDPAQSLPNEQAEPEVMTKIAVPEGADYE